MRSAHGGRVAFRLGDAITSGRAEPLVTAQCVAQVAVQAAYGGRVEAARAFAQEWLAQQPPQARAVLYNEWLDWLARRGATRLARSLAASAPDEIDLSQSLTTLVAVLAFRKQCEQAIETIEQSLPAQVITKQPSNSSARFTMSKTTQIPKLRMRDQLIAQVTRSLARAGDWETAASLTARILTPERVAETLLEIQRLAGEVGR